MAEWSGDKIRIRPSAIDGFYNCGWQWYSTFILGQRSMPGARAAIGTAIHAAAEAMWQDAILSKKKDVNLTKLHDVAISEFQEIIKEDEIRYDNGEDQNTAESEIVAGTTCFVHDIVPFTDIPLAVEQRYTIELDHTVVRDLSGTVDYISSNAIADVKTSKRKPVPANYVTQQSIYKMLAEANGCTVDHSVIQGVVLKKEPAGHILELTPNVTQAKSLVNTMLDTLDVFAEDKVDPKLLFRGNPKYYLCSNKYCALHATCPFVNGEVEPAQQRAVKL